MREFSNAFDDGFFHLNTDEPQNTQTFTTKAECDQRGRFYCASTLPCVKSTYFNGAYVPAITVCNVDWLLNVYI